MKGKKGPRTRQNAALYRFYSKTQCRTVLYNKNSTQTDDLQLHLFVLFDLTPLIYRGVVRVYEVATL